MNMDGTPLWLPIGAAETTASTGGTFSTEPSPEVTAESLAHVMAAIRDIGIVSLGLNSSAFAPLLRLSSADEAALHAEAFRARMARYGFAFGASEVRPLMHLVTMLVDSVKLTPRERRAAARWARGARKRRRHRLLREARGIARTVREANR